MKIGILTLPLHTNYGGVMQAYALQKYLEKSGYITEHINIRPSIHEKGLKVIYLKFKLFLKNKLGNLDDRNVYRNKNFAEFINNELKTTNLIFFKSQLRNKNIQNFDAYIVGSDQVWRSSYSINVPLYFFNFVKEKKRFISYAASFGLDKLEYSKNDLYKCSKLLKRFRAVSVRENSGITLLSEKLNTSSIRVLDPVFLLDKSDYLSLVNKYSTDDKDDGNGVFAYILDNCKDKLAIVKKVSQLLGCKKTIFNEGLSRDNKKGIGDWLKGFNNANFVVTDSFHGVAFSIIFNKPFIAIGNIDRGLSRFKTILECFNIQERLYIDGESSIEEIVNTKINFNNIEKKISSEILKSSSFIKASLSS